MQLCLDPCARCGQADAVNQVLHPLFINSLASSYMLTTLDVRLSVGKPSVLHALMHLSPCMNKLSDSVTLIKYAECVGAACLFKALVT